MARSAASGRVAATGRVAASGRFLRQDWVPSQLGSIVAESWADTGVTMGTIPRASGTSPPVVTYSGTLTGGIWPYIQIDSVAGGTALGQATYKVSYDDGATFPHTGITTAAGPVALPGVGSAISVSFAAGPYNTNNIYQPLCAQINDTNGTNHASEATAANRPILRMVAFNTRKCLDFGTAGTFGLSTPSVSLGAYSVFILLRGDANSTWTFVHNAVANGVGSEIFSRSTFDISLVPPSGSANKSAKNINNTWLSDGIRRSVTITYDGTHATHLVYRNTNLDTTSDATTAHDPGVASRTGSLYFGYPPAKSSGHQGLIVGWVVASRAWTAAEVERLHIYATTRFPL